MALLDGRAERRAARASQIRRRAGIHERTYLKSTPVGDLVIVTLEGHDAGRAFGKMMSADDEFTKWFTGARPGDRGIDLTARPTGSPSGLIIDTDPVAVHTS